MATEVQANFGDPLAPINAMYAAQNQRMSLMERSQKQQQDRLNMQLLEAKKAQWDVEAPLRQLQFETSMAEEGTKMYATQDTLRSVRELEQNSPTFIQMMKDADLVENDEEGEPKYDSNFVKWGKVVAALSPYSNTTKGKQMIEAAKAQQMNYRMAYANVLDFKEKKLTKQAKLDELQKVIVDGNLMFKDPKTGDVAPYRGAFPSVEQAAELEMAKTEGRAKAESNQKYIDELEKAADSASQDVVGINSAISLLASKKADTGYGQSAINTFFAVASQFGLPIDETKLQNNQYIEQQLSLLKIRGAAQLMRGQGQITEKEREMLEKATANINLLPETNIRILKAMAAMMQRNKELNKIKNAMLADKKSPAEIRLAIEQYKQEHDQSFEIEENQGAGGAKEIKSKAEFDALPSGAQFIYNGKTGTKK